MPTGQNSRAERVKDIGRLEHWSDEVMKKWSNGVKELDDWSDGVME